MIHLLNERAIPEQVAEMEEALGSYIKLAVDVERKTVAGGGVLHADCEAVLLADGSMQENVWGADWIPYLKEVTFESLINIRSRQNNFSMEIEDEDLRTKIRSIVTEIFTD